MNVLSEDGVTYTITPFEAYPQNLEFLYNVFQKHDILVADPHRNDVDAYLDYMMSPNVVVWSIVDEGNKPVGIVYADRIIPKFNAHVHYIFWDLRTKGRQVLLLSVLRAFMDEMALHRVTMEVPLFAYAALNRIRHMGFLLEGRIKESTLRNGKWQDQLRFCVLSEDLTPERVAAGSLDPEKVRGAWFKVLEDEPVLASYFLKKER